MELLILNPVLQKIVVLDVFESLIWTDKYFECGDFEIYTTISSETWNSLEPGNYIFNKDSEHVMIIEDREIKTDVEDGDRLIVKGRSMESILDRRIIWNETKLSMNLQDGIELLLNQNVITPAISARQIPNIIFEASTDPAITSLTVDIQLDKTNLYESIKNLCETKNIAFKIVLSSDFSTFVFTLYKAQDRSYAQSTNSYVVFSRNFENLISSNYTETYSKSKTVTLVEGQPLYEEDPSPTKIVGSGTGIERREVYTDAKDLSWTVDEAYISLPEYESYMVQRGNELLLKNVIDTSLDCEIDITRMFKYREDFFIGDIVQVVADYGITGRAQIVEMVRSQGLNGIEIQPKFNIID